MPSHGMSTSTPTESRRYSDRKWVLGTLFAAFSLLGGFTAWAIGAVREATNIESQVRANTEWKNEHREKAGHAPVLQDVAVMKTDITYIKRSVDDINDKLDGINITGPNRRRPR